MATTIGKYWNVRKVKEEKVFDVAGEFQSMWAAQGWLSENGYHYGSSCREMPVAITRRPYDLPQKWKNFDKEDKQMIDGVLITSFREGPAKVILFEDKTVL